MYTKQRGPGGKKDILDNDQASVPAKKWPHEIEPEFDVNAEQLAKFIEGSADQNKKHFPNGFAHLYYKRPDGHEIKVVVVWRPQFFPA